MRAGRSYTPALNLPHMQLSGLKSPPYFEERSESIDPGSRSRHAALGMYLPSIVETLQRQYRMRVYFRRAQKQDRSQEIEKGIFFIITGVAS